jgi:hypothetical protein
MSLGNEREKGPQRNPKPRKKPSFGHELFEQATNEYAPVSHIILPWFDEDVPHFSLHTNPLLIQFHVFFSSLSPFTLFRTLPNNALSIVTQSTGWLFFSFLWLSTYTVLYYVAAPVDLTKSDF